MARPSKQFYEFGPFRIDVAERLLMRNDEVVPLTPRVFDTLLVLVENPGHILTKGELMNSVWAETVVEEANLTKNISTLRKALGESANGKDYIETIPWRGYRFSEDVREIGNGSADLVIEEHTRSSIVIEEQTNELPTSSRNTRVLFKTVAIFAFVAVVAGVVFWIASRDRQASSTPAITSIAVLPLENLSGDPSQEYFADGMTELLINNMARVRALRVISKASVMRYKGTTKPIGEIARELNVDAIVTGAVQRTEQRVRITAQLIHAATDTHIWARDYERDLTDVLKLQGEVSRDIAEGVRIQVTPDENARLSSERNVNPEAHQAYLLGRFHFSKNNEQDYRIAFEHFQRATRLAPDYAPGFAALSNAWLQLGIFDIKPFKEVESPARAAALRAVELDDQLAEAHVSLGLLKYSYDWDWTGAEQEFKRALELDPGSLEGHRHYGRLLMCIGRHDEAVREGERAVELDPFSPETHTDLGRFLFRARRYNDAVSRLQRAVEMEPRSADANFRLGESYLELGRFDEGIAVFQKAQELTGTKGRWKSGIARANAMMGRRDVARRMLSSPEIEGYGRAEVLAALGDIDGAFAIIEKAVDERNSLLVILKEDPPMDKLRSDPRWAKLMRRMNFP